MIAAEIQQRDEALTAAGHDPECAAFDDRECSCGVQTFGQTIVARNGKPPRSLAMNEIGPMRVASPDSVVLEGDHARAYRRWTEAMRALGAAKTAFASAGQEAQAAHEALAMLSVGAP